MGPALLTGILRPRDNQPAAGPEPEAAAGGAGDPSGQPMDRRASGLAVGPMGEDLVLWRCLHDGPLRSGTIDRPTPHPRIDWPATRARNLPLLRKLIETYGTCAIAARDGDTVVGTLRFYPKELCEFGDGGAAFCLQQDYPAGPRDGLASRGWPALEALTDKTLFVHCLMIVAPEEDPGRFRRQGLATRMARELIGWAREKGWRAIEAHAYEEIPMLYAISGVAGRRFWERLGFTCVLEDTEPGMAGEILEAVRKDAVAAGIPAERAANRYTMRLDLDPRRA